MIIYQTILKASRHSFLHDTNTITSKIPVDYCQKIKHEFPRQSLRYKLIGWNDYVKEHHAVARDALWWWKFYNNPRQGPIYHDMKSARARFKYALRATKRAEETARADALANELCENDNDGFGRVFQRLVKHLMLLLVVLMVYQVNVIFQCSGEIISALY